MPNQESVPPARFRYNVRPIPLGGLILGPRTVYSGRKIRLDLRPSVDTDGRTREYEVIVHPGAAVILPLLNDGRVVMIRNQRIAVGRALLELPAGTIDPPEAPAGCAARELTEETGYRAAIMEPLVSFFSSPGISDELMHVFVARGLEPDATRLEPGEKIETVPMEYVDVLDAVRDGRVQDAKTIVAVLFYDRFRRAGRGDAGAV